MEIQERIDARKGTDRAAVVKRSPNLPLTCADCGRDIPAARLAAVPDTKRCTSCQTEQEDREGRVA